MFLNSIVSLFGIPVCYLLVFNCPTENRNNATVSQWLEYEKRGCSSVLSPLTTQFIKDRAGYRWDWEHVLSFAAAAGLCQQNMTVALLPYLSLSKMAGDGGQLTLLSYLNKCWNYNNQDPFYKD